MQNLKHYFLIILTLGLSQWFLQNYVLLVSVWIAAGLLLGYWQTNYVYLKVFLLELIVGGAIIYWNRGQYSYLENWMTVLKQYPYLPYIVVLVFNALNAGFAFLLGSVITKTKKKKYYNSPYKF